MLSTRLNEVFRTYHTRDLIHSDPIEFVHQYRDARDQEIVGLLASQLAYGKVAQIKASLSRVLSISQAAGLSPFAYGQALGTESFYKDANHAFKQVVHRFNLGTDILKLWRIGARAQAEAGSLGKYFYSFHHGSTHRPITDALSRALADLTRRGKDLGRPTTGFTYFLSSPENGSACKRWCMYFRWMVRKDAIDLGIWKDFSPAQLMIPLDTHTGRISSYLGLTKRQTMNWKAVEEVTEALRQIDPQDPVRFDFALSRLGILDLCQKRFRVEICKQCQLWGVCQYANPKKS